jgi:hypothetical protein
MGRCGRNFVELVQHVVFFPVWACIASPPPQFPLSPLPVNYPRHGAGRTRKRKRGSGEMGQRAMELAQTLADVALANAGSSGSRG